VALESLAGVQQPIITVKRAVAQGDLAMVHSHYAWTPSFELDGGLRHRGRHLPLRPGRQIVGHWDDGGPCQGDRQRQHHGRRAGDPTPRRRRSSWRARRSWRYFDVLGPATPPPRRVIAAVASTLARGWRSLAVQSFLARWDRWSWTSTAPSARRPFLTPLPLQDLQDGRCRHLAAGGRPHRRDVGCAAGVPASTASGCDMFAQLSNGVVQRPSRIVRAVCCEPAAVSPLKIGRVSGVLGGGRLGHLRSLGA
jgi:hypothetical protein